MSRASRIQLSEPGVDRVIIDLDDRPGGTITVGNADKSSSHIRLISQMVYISDYHCTLSKVDNDIWIRDGAFRINTWVPSKNGTYVNGEVIPVNQQIELKPGDWVCLGNPQNKIFSGYRITILSDDTKNETSTGDDKRHAEIIRRCRTESTRRDGCGVVGLEVLPIGLGTRIKFTDASAEEYLGFQRGELVQAIDELGLEECISSKEKNAIQEAVENAVLHDALVSGTYERPAGDRVTISLYRERYDCLPAEYFVVALIYPPISRGAKATQPRDCPSKTDDTENAAQITAQLLVFIDKRPLLGWACLIMWGLTLGLIALLTFL